ncbi:MAG: PTS sugar transporter subunit IIC [Gemmatimonadales bacterium]
MRLAMLWLWATLAGLDLVSVLQALLSRPLVIGAGAGALAGDVEAGLRVGALLELFALDVVPVGSSRYPDFGAATVAATLMAAGHDWTVVLGMAAGAGIMLGMAAGVTLPMTRRLSAQVVQRFSDRLSAGDARALARVHWTCLGYDVVRSALVAAVAVGLGVLVARSGWTPPAGLGMALTTVALAGAAWSVAHGAVASARSGPRWRWVAAGTAVGVLGASVL